MLTMLVAATALITGCNDPPREAGAAVSTPGHPFQALPSADGCWVFASVTPGPDGGETGVAVFRRSGGTLTLRRVVRLEGEPGGMALTRDGAMLIVAAGDRVAFLDVRRMIGDSADPLLGYQVDSTASGRVYANVTRDGRFAVIADEATRSVSVIDLGKARRSGFAASSTVGKIPTGTSPIALTISPDEKWMFVTSQLAPAELHWPAKCRRQGGARQNDSSLVNPEGAIHVVDLERARIDPEHSIVANVPAGCNPVRLALSPDGTRAYLTARGSNALIVFDVARLRSDPLHAEIARAQVGTAPVGVAVSSDGDRVIVTNSNRFGGAADERQTLTVIDAQKATKGEASIVGSVTAGAFPRELRVTGDGRSLILTNFGSGTIQVFDLGHLPLAQRE